MLVSSDLSPQAINEIEFGQRGSSSVLQMGLYLQMLANCHCVWHMVHITNPISYQSMGGNMWKNIMATACLVLSVGITYQKLIQSANAQLGPQVSAGQNPIVNYGGNINQGVPVFTAPVDQDVIVTTLITNETRCGYG